MVGHHYGRIDDYTERDRNAGKGIDVHCNIKNIVENYRRKDIGRKSEGYHQEVSP